MKSSKIELVVVFKKEVELTVAEQFLDSTGIPYREGMDSSRGKLYFYKTGEKFILTFETSDQREKFMTTHEGSELIYEIYKPNWNIQKD